MHAVAFAPAGGRAGAVPRAGREASKDEQRPDAYAISG